MTCSSTEQAVRSARGRLSARNYKYYLSKRGRCSQSCEAATAEISTSRSVVSTNVSECINRELREQIVLWSSHICKDTGLMFTSESSQLGYHHTFLFCPFRLSSSPAEHK